LGLDALGLNTEATLALNVTGSYVKKLNRFASATDPNLADPELRELQRPQWAFGTNLTYNNEAFTFNWGTIWTGRTYLRSVEAEDSADFFPNSGPPRWVNNFSVAYQFGEHFKATAGVNNAFKVKPYITETSIPVSGIGRSFFLRGSAKF
jgi:outer membrane receptor protein involved in Fe transport